MIFTYAVDTLDEVPFTIQKSLTEINGINQADYNNYQTIKNLTNIIDTPSFNENINSINKVLLKLHKNKDKIIMRYDHILNYLDETLMTFDEEINRCKENMAISAMKIKASNIDTALNEDDDGKYCKCNSRNRGDMVACDAIDCPIEWFHLECVGLAEPPKGRWICEDCRNKQ